jgi:NRE family putative nickel resistance protein-like MFS transporter
VDKRGQQKQKASENPASPDRGGLFANRDFARLFAAQATSLVGSGVTSVALAAFAYELTGRDATTVVGTALALRILAFVTLSPVAGVLADRVDRKRMLVAADVLRVLLLGAFPFITAVWQIHALIFAINAVTAFFTPTFEASIPDLVGPQRYTRAVALSRVATDLESIGGPLVAGVLIALVGVRWTFWFDAATYVASALLVWRSRVPRAPRPTTPFPWGDFASQVTHGTRLLLREPALRQALLLHVAEAAAGAAAIVATVVYVRDVLGRGETAFAVAMAAVGVGSSVAAVLVTRRAERAEHVDPGAVHGDRALAVHLRHHRWASRTLIGGGLLLTVALLPGVLRPPYLVLLALWALNGAGQALVAVPSVGLLASHTAPDERGRAYAAHFALTHLFWLGTYPAVGFLGRAVGVPATFTLAGVVTALATVAALLAGRPHRPHPVAPVAR